MTTEALMINSGGDGLLLVLASFICIFALLLVVLAIAYFGMGEYVNGAIFSIGAILVIWFVTYLFNLESGYDKNYKQMEADIKVYRALDVKYVWVEESTTTPYYRMYKSANTEDKVIEFHCSKDYLILKTSGKVR
jgi:hypothetical protein